MEASGSERTEKNDPSQETGRTRGKGRPKGKEQRQGIERNQSKNTYGEECFNEKSQNTRKDNKRKKNERSERRGDEQQNGDRGGGGGPGGDGQGVKCGGLTLLYTNAQSILSKLPDLEATAHNFKPDIILITESWCNKTISDNVLKVIGYDLISDLRKDRTDTTNGIGGGILVYAKNGLAVLSIDNLSDFNQYAHFKISTSLCDMNIFLIYRPPSSSKANNEMLCNLIKNAPKDSLIIGDINFPKIDWNNLTSDTFSSDFLNSCIDNNFSQYVDFPTHSKNNILDLVLCNNDCVLNAENLGPLSNSDHVMILIRTCFDFVSTNNNDVKLNWSRANYSELKDEIANVDWPNLLSNDDVNLNWANFKQKLNTVIYKHVPLITTTSDNSKPIWMNNYIKRMLRKKSRLYKKMKLTKSESDTKNYKDAEKVTKKAIRNAKKKVEVRISKQNGNEGKNSFNKYVKSRLGKQTGIGPLLDEHNTVTSDGKKMADILNEHFSSVFSKDNVNVNNIEDLVFDSPIEDLIITKQDIEDKIDKLKPGKAPGPDGISTTLLIKLKFVISIPLQILFQESLSKGCVPTEWKKAKVIPIFKKGSKGKASNYRPVSLTSVACKLLESIIRDKITEHLIRNKLINTSQHGFTKNRSCQTNLLEFMDFITKCIDQGDPVDVIYLDFSKAFDKISHSKLALKLKAHGIRGKLLSWITDWLTNRSQWVCVNGSNSKETEVGSGVPQGSVLGPLLFVIFINDLDDCVKLIIDLIKKFADDTKAGKCIKNQKNTQELQDGLNKLYEWSEKWSMAFNIKKCKVMHFGRNNPKTKYFINGEELEEDEYERDIGVKISSDLKPSKHCQEAANRARVVLGQISRCFHYRDKVVFLRLYKQYVRPHMEFSSVAWSPWQVNDISVLEEVQVKAVKMISGLQGKDYVEKLKELGLWSLEKRRLMFDLIQMHKLITNIGHVKCNYRHPEVNPERTVTRSQTDSLNIIKERSNLEIRKNFFTVRTADIWNSLPSDIKSIRQVTKFKKRLVQWMSEKKLTSRD